MNYIYKLLKFSGYVGGKIEQSEVVFEKLPVLRFHEVAGCFPFSEAPRGDLYNFGVIRAIKKLQVSREKGGTKLDFADIIYILSGFYEIPDEDLMYHIETRWYDHLEKVEYAELASLTKELCCKVSDNCYILNTQSSPVKLFTNTGGQRFELMIRERDRKYVESVEGHGNVTYIGNSDVINFVRTEIVDNRNSY